MSTKRAGIVWVDAQGEQVLHVINTASGVGSIESAIAAKSNAGVVECWEGPLEQFNATPVVAVYPTVRNSAVLLFEDDIGSTARLYVPSPVSSLFDHTGDTVDPSAASSIISAAIGNLQAGSGNTVSIFKGGYLSKAPTRALESTDVVQFINPFTGKGQIIISTDSAGDYAALPYAGDGEILGAVAGLPAWVTAPIGLPLTFSNTALGADVSIPSANVFVDVLSLTLGAGTWMIAAQAAINSAITSGGITMKVYDGSTTNYASSFSNYGNNGDSYVSVVTKVVLSGSTTVKLALTANAVSSTLVKAAARINGAGNNATQLSALKVG